nr:hypothetical protein [uncultured Aggregatibacter sp.]
MTQIINQPDMNLLNLPDMRVDFDSVTSCSCGLENADELLNYFLPYLEDWNNQRYTTHEFLKKYTNKGISLWTANDVKATENGLCAIQIFLESEVKGYLFFHCKLSPVGTLQ